MFVHFKNQKIELPEGSLLRDLAEKLNLREPSQAVAAAVNDELRDFDAPLKEGDRVEFFNFEDPKGRDIFWHTSAHVLAQAILRLFPNAKPTIGPPIDQGFYYDFADLHLSDQDFEAVEKEVQKILKENFRPKRYAFADKKEALSRFKENPFKQELIQEFEGSITGYAQGEFFDLCRGPHLPSLGKIKAFKIMKTSGAYWRGDKTKPMLTRIYAISFPDRDQLKSYLHVLEEAKKRDHKILGPKLDLFSMKEEAPGIPFIHPKGMVIWNHLIELLREFLEEYHYVEIKTPTLLSQALWQQSGHWDYYRDNMYTFEVEERFFAIKPMNCPGCILYYKGQTHSYRELPLRIAEIGLVHRYEHSGALSGLFRVRGFHQDDAHIFMRPTDIKAEILSVLKLTDKIYSTFGLAYRFELSTRPEKSMGSDEDWQIATDGLKSALDEWAQPYQINEGDGAFYGPKIDIHVKDALGRSWQCGTVQLDMSLPQKFELAYVDNDGMHKSPVMIHRAIFGSIERFFGILIEHFVGKFPLWISPIGVRLIPVADRHLDYAEKIRKQCADAHFRIDVDGSHESVSKKVRDAQLLQINYMLTVGDKEMESQTIAVRTREGGVIGEMDLNSFLNRLKEERDERSLTSLLK